MVCRLSRSGSLLTVLVLLLCPALDQARAQARSTVAATAVQPGLAADTEHTDPRRQPAPPAAPDAYVITAHKPNYVLPVSYTSSLNDAVYFEDDVAVREGLRPEEVKFQISLKTRLNDKALMFARDGLFFGLTIEAWWQLYARDFSSPFRETNYQPEVFYETPLIEGPFGGTSTVVLGLEHQSNGQVQGLSRSWNRLYLRYEYERDNWAAWLRPWYRLPEDAPRFPLDPRGDDNPDIEKFMGYQDFGLGWRQGEREYVLATRFNPASGKGAIDLAIGFPLWGRLRGFVEYFNGYGDALIDYDHHQQRLGIGIAFTPLF